MGLRRLRGRLDAMQGDAQVTMGAARMTLAVAKALLEDIQTVVKSRLSKHEYPREIIFVPEIPKSTGGKVDRKAVKAWSGGP